MCRLVGILTDKHNVMEHLTYALTNQNDAGKETCGLAIMNQYPKCVTNDGSAYFSLCRLKPQDFLGYSGIGHTACGVGLKYQPIALKNGAFLAIDSAKSAAENIVDICENITSEETAVKTALFEIEMSFSLIILTPSGRIIAARNKGRMPLSFGELIHRNKKTREEIRIGLYIASQSGVLGPEGRFLHSVNAGEMVILSQEGYQRHAILPRPDITRCHQEVTFYQRQDNYCGHQPIHQIRRNIGRILAKKFHSIIPVKDPEEWIAIPILQGGLSYLFGFGDESPIQTDPAGSICPVYPTNTKIPIPDGGYSPIKEVIEGKNLVLTDDATKSCKRMAIMERISKEMGARRVCKLIATEIRSSCPYGKDIIFDPQKKIEIDDLIHPTPEELIQAIGNTHRIYCTDCLR